MEFVPLTLDRIGVGSEAGSALEEFSEELSALAAKVADEERYGKKGKISITLELERKGDAIVVGAAVAVRAPAKIRKAAVGYFASGQLLTQDVEQIALPFGRTDPIDRLNAEIDRRAAKRIERDEEDHDPNTGEIRRPRRSPKTAAAVQAKSSTEEEGDDE